MPYLVYVPDDAPWIVADLWGRVDSADLVGARREVGEANEDFSKRCFIFDFTAVDELDMTLEARDGIVDIDRERSLFLSDGRCAMVAPRETISIGLELLASSSEMPLDFRSFENRMAAESWLRGDAPDSGIRAPSRHRARTAGLAEQ